MRPSKCVTALAFVLSAVVSCSVPAGCARILAIMTVSSKSRWNFMSAVLGALTDNGHRVTVFTPFPGGDRENYTEIGMFDAIPPILNNSLAASISKYESVWKMQRVVVAEDRLFCDKLHDDGRLKDILARGLRDHFDVVLVDPRRHDCMSYMAAEASLTLIYAVPVPALFVKEREWTGYASNPATAPNFISRHAVPRTFAQRFSNTVTMFCASIVHRSLEAMYHLIDPKPYDFRASMPPSLVFINGHFVSDMAKPTPPNVISVGGIHLKTPKKIPSDILKFIEDSPRGVILLTFGSLVSLDTLPENAQKAIIDGLAEIPLSILIKYEGEMKNKPTNIMTRSWLPQRDILMHPKVKLFISHGGISGTYEAVDAGVPVLGFPLLFDQHKNIDHLIEAGMAISMEIFSATKRTFVKNVLELITDEKYEKNAKIASNVFRDRPLSPNQSVVYWTDYVVRHRGAPHLKPFGISMPWYQYYLLDVFCVITVSAVVSLFVVGKMLNFFKNGIVQVTLPDSTTKNKTQ